MIEVLKGPTASKRHQLDIIIMCDKDKDMASLIFQSLVKDTGLWNWNEISFFGENVYVCTCVYVNTAN